MRPTRHLALAMASLALLAVGPGNAAAQSDEPAVPANFTATTITSDYSQHSVSSDDAVTHVRADFHPTWTATDPRASGRAAFAVERLEHPGASVHAGTFTLENEGGSWVGTVWGFWDAAGSGHYYIQAEGHGAYEGWTLLADDVCVCDEPISDVTGVIVPGGLPAVE